MQKDEDLEKMESSWDRMAGDYTSHTDLSPSNPHYQELGKLFPESKSQLSVLDLGSGLGYALDSILPKIPNAQVCCMDISSEMLQRLLERLSDYRSQITVRKDSYVTADLGSNQFDFIISAFTVHHLPKPTKLALFRNIYRALKQAGAYFELDGVASLEQERASQEYYVQYVSHREGAELGDWNHDMCLTIPNEVELLRAAGFSSVETPWADIDKDGSGRAIFVAKR